MLRAIIQDELRRAVLAFPDEDVLIGPSSTTAAGFEAFKALNDVVPRPGHKASGEERAWGRRLAKRFGVDTAAYDDGSFVAKGHGNLPGARPREPEAREHPGRRGRLLRGLPRQAGRLARWPSAGRWPKTSPSSRGATVPLDRRRRRPPAADMCAFTDRVEPSDRRRPDRPGATHLRQATAGRRLHRPRGPEQTRAYWDVALPAKRDGVRLARARDPCADPGLGRADTWVERYAEPDKAAPGLGAGSDAWPVPYWWVDGGMAVEHLLLGAVDAGLGAVLLRPVRPRAGRARRARRAGRLARPRHRRPRPPRRPTSPASPPVGRAARRRESSTAAAGEPARCGAWPAHGRG